MATTTERGYGAAHQRERARWKPWVDAGLVDCHAATCLMPERRIRPGDRWHLGHTPDRATWTGPEHEKCNTTEGAIRGNRWDYIRAARRAARPVRRWEL